MKKLSTRLLAVMICIVFQFTMFQGIIVSGYTPAETENTKHVLVKYKKGIANSEKKVKDKKKDNKVNGYKKFTNVDAYSMEVDSSSVNELKNDPDIELVEEDSAIEKLDYQGDYKVTGNVLSDLYKNQFITNQTCECGCESVDNCTCSDCLANECKGDDECKCSCTENEKAHVHAAEASDSEDVVNNDDSNTIKTTSKGDKIGWNISAIGADKVHEKGVYGKGVKVAVFDSGIDLDNEDIDVVGGVSFVEGDTSYDDVNGHGTEMAAILASKENGIGLVGVAPEIQLYSVKILNQMGQGRYSSIIEGIDWAIENNIKIIAMSFGGYQNSVILRDAIKKASDNNIVVIAASGNDGTNTICYPAAYQEVICVGAVDKSNVLASFSNTGRQMDLVAPGVEVETVNANGETFLATGTSASVPHVAGAAALLLGEKSDLTNGQVKYLLYKNTIEKGPLELFGNGLVNIENSYDNLLSGTYEEVIKDEDGDVIGESDLDVGGDGIVHALGCGYCGCSSYSCWSSYGIAYGAHTSGGHSTLYYCTASNCGCFSCKYSGPIASGWAMTNNSTQHWQRCTVPGCSATQNPSSHTYVISSTHPHYSFCSVCGYSNNTPNVSWTYESNGTQHWQKCTRCSQTQGQASCTYNTPQATHPHYSNCTTCNFQKTNVSANCCTCQGHSWSTTKTWDGNQHWFYCTREGASVKKDVENHVLVMTNDATQHWYICLGCPIPYTKYNHTWATRYDATNHWEYCTASGCNATRNVTLHTKNSFVISPTHDDVLGHLKTYTCTCGSTSTERVKVAGCPACVSPTLLITADDFIQKGFTATDTSYKPTIKVYDAYAADTITCKYFIDSETTPRATETFTNANPEKTYNFNTAFNPLTIPNAAGAHTLKVVISDAINAPVEKSVCFFVRPYLKTYTLSCANNETTDMIFTASGVVDFTKHKFRITYLPADLDVLDLCTQTSKIDLAVGAVTGSNITITTFNTTSGIIEFTVSNPNTLSRAWKGIVDIIKFKSKKAGPINVTYEIQ